MIVPHGRELSTFLGRQVPVELLAEVVAVEPDARGVTLRLSTLVFTPVLADYYGTVVETMPAEPVEGDGATLRLDACAQGILRLRFAAGGEVADRRTAMLAELPADPLDIAVTQTDATIELTLGASQVTVERSPLRLVVRGPSGEVVCRTRPIDLPAFASRPPEWNTAEGRWIFHHRYGYPAGWTCDGRDQSFLTFDLAHDERVHGFGESFGSYDKRGTSQQLWVEEAFSNTSPASYKQVPFYLTSRGYGLFVHSSNAMTFRVGELDHTALSVVVDDTRELDLFVIVGPTPREILPRYTRLTGAPGLPPVWSFGLWMSRITYASQEQVQRVARELREQRIPTDVLHIDTGWFETDYVCDLAFGSRFPDPAAMTRDLDALGFKVSLWQWPLVNVHSPLFGEAMAGGHLVRRASGHVYLLPGGFGEDAALIDYTRPETVAWVQDKLRALLELGVAVIKVDYGEGAPPDGVYVGAESHEAHNLYPLLYQRAVYEVTEQVRGPGEAMIWGRSGWAGSQRYPVHWSGDGVARFEDLACVLRSMLSMGLSGFPFSSHDIGGFIGTPTPELYVRWAQLGLLSSHARAHGSPPREPWEFGDEALAAFRATAELRYRLLPYLWTAAGASAAASVPLVRPLVIDHPHDPIAARIDDAYLLGPDLLVAPILEETGRRRVYLPAGHWVDWWTDEILEGGRYLDVEVAMDRVPLFVRGGAVLPLHPVVQHTGEVRLDDVTWTLWAPRADARGEAVWPGQEPLVLEVAVDGGVVEAVTADDRDVAVEVRAAPATHAATIHREPDGRRRWRWTSPGSSPGSPPGPDAVRSQ